MFTCNVEVVLGDITKMEVDAVVNAAKNSLLGGGGVDGAIHRVGGSSILKECAEISRKLGGCETGCAVHTTAGKLPAKYVIHTVGPVWDHGTSDEDLLLQSAYKSCLELATDLGARSIAFPCISTGAYNFPKKRAAEIALSTVFTYLLTNDWIEEVYFVCGGEENLRIYETLLERRQFGLIEDGEITPITSLQHINLASKDADLLFNEGDDAVYDRIVSCLNEEDCPDDVYSAVAESATTDYPMDMDDECDEDSEGDKLTIYIVTDDSDKYPMDMSDECSEAFEDDKLAIYIVTDDSDKYPMGMNDEETPADDDCMSSHVNDDAEDELLSLSESQKR